MGNLSHSLVATGGRIARLVVLVAAGAAVLGGLLVVVVADPDLNRSETTQLDGVTDSLDDRPLLLSYAIDVVEEPVVEDGPAVFTYGDDPDLDQLWDACAEGFGSACDELFEQSPLHSEYERFGLTCGERPEILHCSQVNPASETPLVSDH